MLLALAGLAAGVRPLVACGCALLCVAVIAVLWTRAGVRGITVRRTLIERRVVEGEPLEAVIEVRGRHALLFGVRVSDPFSGERLPVRGRGWMPGAGGVRRKRVMTTAGQRGRQSFAPAHLVLDDPLGLALARSSARGGHDEVLILPRVEAVSWSALGWRAIGGDREAGQAVSGAGEIDGLRDYELGTPATRIHWASLARGAGLLERRLVAAAETRPTVVLDARGERDPAGSAHLDEAVRAAASLVLELAGSGGCGALLPGSRMPVVVGHNLQGWAALHTQLALVEGQWHAGPGPVIRPEAVRGPLIYVSAMAVPPPPVTRRSPYPVVLVRPSALPPADGRAVFEVAGCSGYMLHHSSTRRPLG